MEEEQNLGEPGDAPTATVSGQKSFSDLLNEMEQRANAATPGPWEFQTGCSWRRFGAHGDGDVCCPTNHPIDNHVDLLIETRDGDFIAAARSDLPALVKALRHCYAEAVNLFNDAGETDRRDLFELTLAQLLSEPGKKERG